MCCGRSRGGRQSLAVGSSPEDPHAGGAPDAFALEYSLPCSRHGSRSGGGATLAICEEGRSVDWHEDRLLGLALDEHRYSGALDGRASSTAFTTSVGGAGAMLGFDAPMGRTKSFRAVLTSIVGPNDAGGPRMTNEIEIFDGARLVDIATCHHPLSLLPRTMTGLGKVFLGVAQLRAQNKLFELEAKQLQNDRDYKIALVAAQRDLGMATLRHRGEELAAAQAAAQRQDLLRALMIQAKNADLERRHQQKLLLIEDSYQLAVILLRQREREMRGLVQSNRQALAVSITATAGVREALGAATSLMTRPGQSAVQQEWSQTTVIQLASDLKDLGVSASVALGRLLDASSRSAEIAFQGLFEVRA